MYPSFIVMFRGDFLHSISGCLDHTIVVHEIIKHAKDNKKDMLALVTWHEKKGGKSSQSAMR